MNELAVLTPSYRGDAHLFVDLHQSVLENTVPGVVHHVVVPPADRHLFTQFVGDRCRLWTHQELLPHRYVSVPWSSGMAINVLRPWPPVRGWVVQQLMKMLATSAIDADVVLIVDSDAVLIRAVSGVDLKVNGAIGHYRIDDAMTDGMERHVLWHNVARKLLGLPGVARPPLPDYVSAMSVWDPSILRALAAHIEQVTGKNWLDAVSGQLHVSEFVLYGVYVDQVLGGREPLRGALCHNFYRREPMTAEDAMEFVELMPDESFGVMVSSHSRTPDAVRQAVFQRCREIARGSADRRGQSSA